MDTGWFCPYLIYVWLRLSFSIILVCAFLVTCTERLGFLSFFLSSVSFFGKADQCVKLPSGSLKTQTSVISSDNPMRLTPHRNRTKLSLCMCVCVCMSTCVNACVCECGVYCVRNREDSILYCEVRRQFIMQLWASIFFAPNLKGIVLLQIKLAGSISLGL